MPVRWAAGFGDVDPLAPTRAVNHASQIAVTSFAWLAVLGVVVVAVAMARRRGSLMPVGVVVAAAVNSFNEPLWDKAYHLFWYAPGQWTMFSAFGYPQPVWIMAIYIVIYAGGGLFIMTRIEQGAGQRFLFGAFAVAAVAVAVLESTVIAIGDYAYYGPLEFRLFTHYPLWVAVMEGAHVAVWGALIALAGPLLRRWGVLLLIPLFALEFSAVMFGAGMPGIEVINANGLTGLDRSLGAVGSVVLAGSMVWLVAQLLPASGQARSRGVAGRLRAIADQLDPGAAASPAASVPAVRARESVTT